LHLVPALASDDVERAARAVDGLVENDVVLERIGPDDIVVVGIPGAPYQTAGAILRARDRLEFHLDEAILDVRSFFEGERIGGRTGLVEDLALRGSRLIAFHGPFGRAPAGHGD